MLGGLGSSLHLLRRELGYVTCLRMALPEHGASVYSMIRTACLPDQIASLYHHMWGPLQGSMELQLCSTRPIRRHHTLYQPYCCMRHEPWSTAVGVLCRLVTLCLIQNANNGMDLVSTALYNTLCT